MGPTDSSHPGGIPQSQLGLDAVYEYLPATGAQLIHGLRFDSEMALLVNRDIARCMTGLGFGAADDPYIRWDEKYLNPVQGSPVAAGWRGQNLSDVPNLYDVPLLAAKGGLLAYVRLGAPGPPGNLPASLQEAIDHDFRRCQARAEKPFGPLNRDGDTLGQLWSRQVSSVQASAAVVTANASFGLCVRKSGGPASAASSPDQFTFWLTLVLHPKVYPYGRAAMIDSEIALDRHWTTVFVACASPLLSLEQHLQLRAQKAFFQDHFQLIQALEQLAARIVDKAKNAT